MDKPGKNFIAPYRTVCKKRQSNAEIVYNLTVATAFDLVCVSRKTLNPVAGTSYHC